MLAQAVSLAQLTHCASQFASMHLVAGSQSCGHDLAVSFVLQMPLLQPVGGQSSGQLVLVSPDEHVRSPHTLAAGQSAAHEAFVSGGSHVPLPQTGPVDAQVNEVVQTVLPPQTPQVPLQAAGLPHL